jgi:hypothetical protein
MGYLCSKFTKADIRIRGEIAMTTMWKAYIETTRAPVEVEVEKVTDKSVWIDGRRRSRETDWECYFETYQEAKQALIENKMAKVLAAEKELAHLRAELVKLLEFD